MEEQIKQERCKEGAGSSWRSVLAGLGYFGIYLGCQVLSGAVFILIFIFQHLPFSNAHTPASLLPMALEAMQTQFSQYSLISNLTTLGVLALFFFIRKKNPLKACSILPPRAGESLAIMIPLGISLNLFVSALLGLLPENLISGYLEASNQVMTGNGALLLIAVILVAPITEEVVFRGLIYGRFQRGMPKWAAVLSASLLFGLMHGQILWILYTFLVGALFCLVFSKRGTLLSTMVLHISFNGGSFLAGLLSGASQLAVMGAAGLVAALLLVRIFKKETARDALEPPLNKN